MSVDPTGAGTDPGGTDPGTGGDQTQDQAKDEVRAQPEIDYSQASVGDIPDDPAALVAVWDTNFGGTAVA